MTAPSAPNEFTWIIGLSAGILGLIGLFAVVQILTEYNYTLLVGRFIALAVGTSFRVL
jgi:hypothetical protein